MKQEKKNHNKLGFSLKNKLTFNLKLQYIIWSYTCTCTNKMKNNKYYTVRTVRKLNPNFID